MIKTEKIPKIYPKNPKKFAAELSSAFGGGVRLRRTGEDFSDFSMTGGF